MSEAREAGAAYTFSPDRPPTDDPGWKLYRRDYVDLLSWVCPLDDSNRDRLLELAGFSENRLARSAAALGFFDGSGGWVYFDRPVECHPDHTLVDPQPSWRSPRVPLHLLPGHRLPGCDWEVQSITIYNDKQVIAYGRSAEPITVDADGMVEVQPPEPEMVAVMLPVDVVKRRTDGDHGTEDTATIDDACRAALADRGANP